VYVLSEIGSFYFSEDHQAPPAFEAFHVKRIADALHVDGPAVLERHLNALDGVAHGRTSLLGCDAAKCRPQNSAILDDRRTGKQQFLGVLGEIQKDKRGDI
jgi:hypothetical protein